MNARGKCSQCNRMMEFDSDDMGKTAECPNCGQSTVLIDPKIKAKQEAEFKAQAEMAHIEGRRKRLALAEEQRRQKSDAVDEFRQNGHYNLARKLLNAYVILSVLMVVLFILAYFAAIFSRQGSPHDADFQVALANLFVAFLSKYIGYAILDMADCAMEKRAAESSKRA